jgi:nitrogen fixation protein FixH
MESTRPNRGFTGTHMAIIMVAFFGTIIGANSLMAYYAGASWSGMLAKNTYVASQDFNRKAAEAREWARLGFRGTVRVEGTALHYRLEGPVAVISGVGTILASFHRPVGDKQDFAIELTPLGDGSYSAQHKLEAGPWIVDLEAKSAGKTIFHHAERIVVAEGTL